ncbi:MAG: ketosteroid isomerase-like protein [Verrucomicrobiales bacterium]|jgi:ketosteroid isomerase-like protein
MKSFLIVLLFICASTAVAQEEDPIHEQLRVTRAAVIEAIESRDIDLMMAFVHPDVTVTWQNGETCHGVDELRRFYDRMGKDAFVKFKVPHEADRLSVLHGDDTAISSGRVVADYVLLGKSYEFESRWTATLVLQDGKWLIAGYHISLNALDNPILNAAKPAVWIAAIVGLVVGLVLALLICRLRRKRSP